MLGRKKHKRIEIQRVSERKHRKPDPPIEKQMLTRRTFVFKGLAATSFAALTGRLWQLQFRDRAEIQAQETVYGTRRFLLPASRGMIFDRRGELIADNLKSWAVSIVPAELPDGGTPEGQAQRAAIYDTLARTLGMPDVVAVVPADLNGEQGDRARREREDIYARLAATLGLPVEEIRERVEAELEAGRDPKRGFRPWVRIGKEFPPDRLAAIRAAEAEWKSLGVQVINQIRYLVDVNGLYEQHIPKLIKRDIPKEVALGIEANRIYLSGVRIDDQYLGRRYHVGDELGHVLGYTAAISAEEYEAAVERDERGEPLRFGPDGQVRHIYQPDDHIGKAGIEAGLEETLRGKPGRSIARVNAMGRVIDEYVEKRQEPADGHSVVLSIDLNYQRDVIAILQDQLNRTNDYIENERNAERRREGKQPFKLASGAGAAVALDVRTGEVLAMVSLPGYDPRLFVEGISQAQFDRYAEAGVPVEKRLYPLMNRCVESEQAPGSTLKIFVAAAGLQEAAITPDSKYKCLGHIGVPLNGNENNREKYWCWTRDASHQDQDVRTAIATSCDVFFYALGGPRQQDEYTKLDLHYYQPNSNDMQFFNGLGIARINQYLEHFGFGSKTGVELPSEVTGLVPGADWKEKMYPGDFWALGDTMVTAIGQGYDLATPLQLCNATAAIANGGTLWRPTLVHELRDSQGNVVRKQPQALRKLPVSAATLRVVREGMLKTIKDPDGLASQVSRNNGNQFPLPPGIDAGVKTGSAEYGTDRDPVDGLLLRAHAWCTAFAPYDDPEIAVVSFIEGGIGSTGVAAPVCSKMISAYFARKNAGQ